MITYHQTTGRISEGDDRLIATGYSGHGPGLNNPAMEQVHNIGPIPKGQYEMVVYYDWHGDKGPDVIGLKPKGHDAHGRRGLLVHGDNSKGDKSGSEGCIVAPRFARAMMWKDKEKLIEVVE